MKTKVPLNIVELENENYHLLVNVMFFDGKLGYWVVDTGASRSVFDQKLVKYYDVLGEKTDEMHTAGVGDKPIETEIAELKLFKMGKIKIDKLNVAIIDLSHINNLYSKAADLKICGLLGGDFFMRYKAVIDYKKKTMKLSE